MKKAISSNTYSDFLAWLKAGREKRGMTIRELADALGEHSSVIGKIETGQRRMDIYEYCQYCRVLQIKPVEGLKILDRI